MPKHSLPFLARRRVSAMPYPLLALLIIPAIAGDVSLFAPQPVGTVLTAIQTDTAGNIYIAGALVPSNATTSNIYDAFVAKLSADGSQVYRTVLAGSGTDYASAIAIAADGSVYVAGLTSSQDFPITSKALQPKLGSANQAFVAKLSPSGQIQSATYFGGSALTYASALAITATGDVDLTGASSGDGFPATPGNTSPGNGFYLAKFDGGLTNSNDLPGLSAPVPSGCRPTVNQGLGFVVRISTDGTSLSPTKLIYGAPSCTYASCFVDTEATSSNAWVVAAKPDGSAVAAGSNGAVAAIDLFSSSRLACLTDPADNVQLTTVAPGQLLSIFGSRITAERVTFNGIAAPLLFASSDQINVQVPYEIAGQDSVEIEVLSSGLEGLMERKTIAVIPRQPSVFLAQDALLAAVPGDFHCGDVAFPSQNQHALALNADGTLNTCSNGARPGSQVTIFMNGLGQTQPAQATGAINPGPPVKLTPSVTGAGILSTTTSPGSISGVAQVQIQSTSAGFLEVAPVVAGVPTREPIVVWIAARPR